MDKDELGEFLRSRRATISPQSAGLPALGRRRVPGLRREELAQLAGVSPDYYVRLEQGRSRNVSDSVLDAVARVLGLDATEREHLVNLARPIRTAAPPRPRRRHVRPGVRLLLDGMDRIPAFVLGRRMDVLAWNALGDAVNGFSGWKVRNAARHAFLDPAAREFYADWDAVAAETVAYLRLDAGRHPDDPLLSTMVGELCIADAEFGRLWAAQQVKEKTFGRKVVRHSLVGELDLAYETLALPGEPDQLLVTYAAPAGSPTDERLRVLSSWTAEPLKPVVGQPPA